MKLQISKSYGEKKVFENLELEIKEGEIVCVLGESGGGKTTLLNILAGLIDYAGERVDVPENVGYIFQEPRLLSNLTVAGNLRYVGGRDEDIDEILQKTEILGLKNKRPTRLSGGERQRVSIARAFLSDAPLLLLDEPFSSLDTALKIRLLEVFAKLWREKPKTAVMVTHDIEEACALAQRIVVLKGGRIVLDIPVEGEIPRAYGSNQELKEKLLQALLA
ncbi:MAG: ABC transporter ATP-binding protein [Clostridiales bacterium]|nr:ABC transporter ATP-binding protein [Clostridiales bacterium]MBQ2768981.1 ABC transporter ATP-binding protein [Clostridia bacterium]